MHLISASLRSTSATLHHVSQEYLYSRTGNVRDNPSNKNQLPLGERPMKVNVLAQTTRFRTHPGRKQATSQGYDGNVVGHEVSIFTAESVCPPSRGTVT